MTLAVSLVKTMEMTAQCAHSVRIASILVRKSTVNSAMTWAALSARTKAGRAKIRNAFNATMTTTFRQRTKSATSVVQVVTSALTRVTATRSATSATLAFS